MKKILNTSTSTSRQPFLGRSIDHLKESQTETINSTVRAILNDGYTTNDVVILWGCVLTGSFSGAGNAFSVTQGAVFYNGEIYEVAAASGTISGTNVLIGSLDISTFQSGDPVQNTDGTMNNVHRIDKFVISQAGTGTGTKDFSLWKPAKKISGRLTLASQTNATTTYADATGLTFTTPNDGKTRKICIRLKGHFHITGTHIGAGGEAKIYNLTTTTDLDSGYAFWQLDVGANFAQMRQSFTASYLGDIAPNTTIKVQFKSLSGSFGIDIVNAVYEYFEI
jgi:hypothetical protein